MTRFLMPVAALTLGLGLAACNQSPAEQAAENTADRIENNADAMAQQTEQKADALEERAANTADAMRNDADAMQEAAENRAEAIEERAENVTR